MLPSFQDDALLITLLLDCKIPRNGYSIFWQRFIPTHSQTQTNKAARMLKSAQTLSAIPEVPISEISGCDGENLCHIYMEAQIFSPDSKHFIVHSGSTPHGTHDPTKHVYYRCDIDDDFSLHPMTDRLQVTCPAISPDGKFFYYIVTNWQRHDHGAPIELRRKNLDGSDDIIITAIPGRLPGSNLLLGEVYPLSTISSDGQRLATRIALFSTRTQCWTYALVVFCLDQGDYFISFSDPEYVNAHPQYSRSLDPVESHDIMLQHNHAHQHDNKRLLDALRAKGVSLAPRAAGTDIHVICDDGTHLRDLPFGRSATEMALGHQCWVGRSNWIIVQCKQWAQPHFINNVPSPFQNPVPDIGVYLFAAQPMERFDHLGVNTPDMHRLPLCTHAPDNWFGHFGGDIEGRRIIVDAMNPERQLSRLYLIRLGNLDQGETPGPDDWKLLGDCLTSNKGPNYGIEHSHPFLSPDGRYAFFNSNVSGILRPYVADLKNLDF
jgi:hypothetical protein